MQFTSHRVWFSLPLGDETDMPVGSRGASYKLDRQPSEHAHMRNRRKDFKAINLVQGREFP